MSLDYLTLDIIYNVNNDKFEIKGDVNKRGQEELISNVLREQIGNGRDDKKAIERETYHIQLKWYPENDTIEVSSDTGNKGLRDGILMHYLKNLS